MEDNSSDSSSSLERASSASAPSTPSRSESEESDIFWSVGSIDSSSTSDDHGGLTDVSFESDMDLEHFDMHISKRKIGERSEPCLPPNIYGPTVVPTRNFIRDYIDLQLGCSSDILRGPISKSKYLVKMLSPIHNLEGHDGCVNCIHFSSDGSLLASGSDDLKVCVWDWAKKKKLFDFETGHSSNVFQSKFLRMEGNPCIVTTSRDGQVRLAELSSSGGCRSTRLLGRHIRRPCHKIALINTNPKTFLTAGGDGNVLVFDVRRSDSLVRTILAYEHQLFGIHSNPVNENEFVVCGLTSFIGLYDLRMRADRNLQSYGPTSRQYRAANRAITGCMFNYNGTEILASYNNNLIMAFHKSGEMVRKHSGHQNEETVKGISYFGPKSEYVISGSDCGNVLFWTGSNLLPFKKTLGDDTGAVNCIEPHPNLPILATSGLDSDVKIWFPQRGDPNLDEDIN